MSECNVCIEKFNNSNRAPVQCSFCGFQACVKCCKTFLLGSITEPSCMNCKKTWDRKFLVANLDQTFIKNALKKHRENILFDRERSMLPSTQIHVENQIRVENLDKEIEELHKKVRQLQAQIKTKKQMRNELVRKPPGHGFHAKPFVRACPFAGCKGFISKDWSCGLCGNKTCRDCHEVMDGEHKCDPGNVASAQLLAKDTKPCPKCGTLIFKISGCNQMFCTQCHTAFGWTTGVIEQGIIHNPHYFEMLRQGLVGPLNPENLGNQGNQGNQGCRVRRIDGNVITGINGLLRGHLSRNTILELCRNIIHIREVELPRYRTNRIEQNLDLRIKYMRNIITEATFKTTIQRREKEISKRNELTGIFEMFLAASTDLVLNLRRDLETHEKSACWNNYKNQLEKLAEYTNIYFAEIQETYGTKRVFTIDPKTFRIIIN